MTDRYAAYRMVHPFGGWWVVATEDEWFHDDWTAKCHTEADAQRIAAALNREDPIEPDICLAFDIDGPHRPSHNLCHRVKGHDGPHGNEEYDWPAACHHDPLDLCDRCRTPTEEAQP